MLARLRRRVLQIAQLDETLELIHDMLVGHDAALAQLLRKLSEKPATTRPCTVMLLWDVPPVAPEAFGYDSPDGWHGWRTAGHPGFMSTTVHLEPEARGDAKFLLECPVPAGAWVIGFNCFLHQVLMGNDLMDVGLPDRSPMCRLSKAGHVGMYLRCTVLPA